MSRQNKVNKNNYVQKGRLTPDDMARERSTQRQVEHEIEHKVPDAKGAARTFTVRGKRGQESTRTRSAPEE